VRGKSPELHASAGRYVGATGLVAPATATRMPLADGLDLFCTERVDGFNKKALNPD
jgi:hypothetical protein